MPGRPDPDPIAGLIGAHRRFRGRGDRPVKSMPGSLFAMSVPRHRSTASFVRGPARNPTLMIMPGFPLRAASHDPEPDTYRVPSESAFCRFRRTLPEVDDRSGCLRQPYRARIEELRQLLPDFGRHAGFDGRALESCSTGRILPHRADEADQTRATSDPDARWGKHVQYGTDANGREVRHTRTWFGYTLHLVGDVTYEMPLDWRLTPANESEQPHCRELARGLPDTAVGKRMRSFVADRGLDGNALRRTLFEADVPGVIDTRNLWRDVNTHPDQLKVPTRSLDDSRTDCVVRSECGDVCRLSPDGDRELRRMHYQGYEARRGTTKWACLAAVYDHECKGREKCWRMGGVRADAKTRIVRTRIDVDHLRNDGPLPQDSYR